MTPAPKRRWLRFTLRGFLVAAAMIPFVFYWGLLYRKANLAAERYEWIQEMAKKERVSYEELFAESKRLRDAQLAVPFSGKTLAYKTHADRIAQARRRLGLMIAADYSPGYWPRVNREYDEAIEQLRDIAGDGYADEIIQLHRKTFPADFATDADGYILGTRPNKTPANTDVPREDPFPPE